MALFLINTGEVIDCNTTCIYIYYSKFDKVQTFNFVCRRSCLSDTKKFMTDM